MFGEDIIKADMERFQQEIRDRIKARYENPLYGMPPIPQPPAPVTECWEASIEKALEDHEELMANVILQIAVADFNSEQENA